MNETNGNVSTTGVATIGTGTDTAITQMRSTERDTARVAPIAYVLQVICRYFIATVLLLYAAAKIFETQFAVEPSALDTPVRFLSGFEFAWLFYGYSYLYGLFLAGAQITVSLLLFFQRTVRLGLLIFFPIMGNILLLDIFYGISAALPAVYALLIAGLYLFLYDIRAFWQYAFGTPFVRSATPLLVRRVHWLKYGFIPLALIGTNGLAYVVSQQTLYQTPLTGIWQFQNTNQYSRLYFDLGANCRLRTTIDQGYSDYFICTVDQQNNTVAIKPYASSPGTSTAVTTSAFTFTGAYTLSADGNHLTLHSSEGGTPQSYTLERIASNYAIHDRLNISGQALPTR